MKRGSHPLIALIVAMKTSMITRLNGSRMGKSYEGVISHSPVALARIVTICSFQLWLWFLRVMYRKQESKNNCSR